MSRRIETKWDIPYSIVKIVVMICADYDRRRIAVDMANESDSVISEYVRLNQIVDSAMSSIEEGVRRVFLDDVSLGRGYDFSPASPFLAKNTYYQRKRKFVHDIAKGLKLI
jgi:hypothetical protein